MSGVTSSQRPTGVLPSLQRFDAKQALAWTALGSTVVGTAAALGAGSSSLAGEAMNPLKVGGKAAGVTAAVIAGVMVLKSLDLPRGHERSMYSGMGVGAATLGAEALVIPLILFPKFGGGNAGKLIGGSLIAAAVGSGIGAAVGLANPGTKEAKS